MPIPLDRDAQGQEWLRGARLVRVDGCDPIATFAAIREALERGRKGEGPSIVIADLIRLSPHSSADPHYLYRSEQELAEDARRDPIARFAELLVRERVLPAEEVERLRKQAFTE